MNNLKIPDFQYAALTNPYEHFAFFGGIACGKTFTGSQWAINMIRNHPEVTGFIGANTYDQLSQATLRELFYWLDKYDVEYVVDQMPPKEWGVRKEFKKYSNILTARIRKNGTYVIATVFLRNLSDPDALRGIEFSWYWIDESRDTPLNTHDVLISRMRESKWIKGFITTTTNGEDWCYKRFVLGADHESLTYGSQHIPTEASVQAGIITRNFYNTLLKSYDPLMAEQELFARHVNVFGGRAYYAAGQHNQATIAPWGAEQPDPNEPLIVGADFNFSPSPCVWMVGQLGPGIWSNYIHWFGEISIDQASTPDMTDALVARFPNAFYRVFGDASGTKGTTSNMGETDYKQMANRFDELGVGYSIDVDQANPRVKSRIETMNAKLMNAAGEVTMTYNPNTCPLFDGDLRIVGWKITNQASGKAKLDGMGDKMRTHASDGAGYAIYKLFPIGSNISRGGSVESASRGEVSNL